MLRGLTVANLQRWSIQSWVMVADLAQTEQNMTHFEIRQMFQFQQLLYRCSWSYQSIVFFDNDRVRGSTGRWNLKAST